MKVMRVKKILIELIVLWRGKGNNCNYRDYMRVGVLYHETATSFWDPCRYNGIGADDRFLRASRRFFYEVRIASHAPAMDAH